MSESKVDIIIPAYNQGHYLQASVESALNQTWGNIEVIIVDDGSTDNTAEVAQTFSDPRVTYIYQENAGLSAARNTGIRHSTGEYISFLDSDDLFFPKKLELLLDAMHKSPELGLCAGKAILIDENGVPKGRNYGKGMPNAPEEWLLGNRIHVGSVLVKSEWLQKTEPFDENLRACEDWDMWLRLSLIGCPMGWIPDNVSQYRVHSQQMTREAVRMKTAMFTVLDKILDEPLSKDWREMAEKAKASALVRAAARAFLAGDSDAASKDISEAVQIAPGLKAEQGTELIQMLKNWAHAPSSADPFEYMVSVFDHMPAEVEISDTTRKHELRSLAINLAFENYSQGEKAGVRRHFLEAAKIDPSAVMNRKLCSIFLQSLLPG
ncbi:MAG: glycosyltransferase [Chloroflexota bacterium]